MSVVEAVTSGSRRRGPQLFRAGVEVDTFEVDTLINAVTKAAGPASMALFGEKVGDYLEDRAANRFASEGDNASGHWKPLALATRSIRASLGYGPDGPINVRTDELFEWAVYSADVEAIPGGGVQVTKPDVDRMSGSALEKLITAQLGRDDNPMIPGATTPPRPVAALHESDMVNILKLLQIHIMGQTVAGVVSGVF